MIEEILKNVGLSDKEIEIYLSALKLGPQPASVLARSAGLNRTTTYAILETLFKKGLISQFIKAEIKYFSVISVDNLVSFVERKINDLRRTKTDLEILIPEIMSFVNPASSRPKVVFLENLQGIKKLYKEIEICDAEIYTLFFFSPDMILQTTDEALEMKYEFLFKRLQNNNCRTLIFADSKNVIEVRNYFRDRNISLEEYIKFIENISFPESLEVNIFFNKVFFITYNEGKLSAVIIEDALISSAIKSIIEEVLKK